MRQLKGLLSCLITSLIGWGLYGQELTENPELVRLPKSINSAFEESKPISSSNGDTLYFVRSFHPDNTGGKKAGSDIWVSYRNQNGEWSAPSNNLAKLNTPDHDLVIGLSENGSTLYTIKYNYVGSKRYVQIMQSQQHQNGWSEPIPLDMEPILLPDGYHEFSMHPSGTVLLISWSAMDSLGEEDLYISELIEGNNWTKPINLGPAINSVGFEISPFLSADKKQLFFASDRPGGMGNSDIWVSTRLQDSPYHWSQPRNLGAKVNSDQFDAFYFQARQGDIYFTSNRYTPQTDIFSLSTINPVDTVVAEPVETASQEQIKSPQILNEVVYFDLDEDFPGTPEVERLEGFITALSETDIDSISVIGFTDHSGEMDYNLDLSRRRAMNVKAIISSRAKGDIPIKSDGRGIYEIEQIPKEMRRVEILVYVSPSVKKG